MNKLFAKIVKLKKVAGLSLHYVTHNEVFISYCLLSIEKGSVDVFDFGTVANFEDLKKKIQDLPVYINVSGKTMIEKVLNTSSDINYTRKAFPNSSEDDFLFQTYTNDISSIVSLIRKNKADEIITKLQQNDFYPISLSLGNSISVNGLESISNFNSENIVLFNKRLNIEDSEIITTESTDEISTDFLIEDKNLTDSEYLAFSVALNAFYKGSVISVPNYLTAENEGYLHKNIFDKLKFGVPLFFLILLLINFLLYSTYLNKNVDLSQSDYQHKLIIERLDSLKKEVNIKKDFLEKSNWLSQSKVSFYADQIGYSTNEHIHLKSLDVFPATLVNKNNTKSYLFENKIINVEGYSESLHYFDEWKLNLPKREWVKDVELISYHQETKNKEIRFKLKISLN